MSGGQRPGWYPYADIKVATVCAAEYRSAMAATLEQIHLDPGILDRAIMRSEPLDIVSDGVVTATVVPKVPASIDEARRVMAARFAARDWKFSVGTPMSRDERNSCR